MVYSGCKGTAPCHLQKLLPHHAFQMWMNCTWRNTLASEPSQIQQLDSETLSWRHRENGFPNQSFADTLKSICSQSNYELLHWLPSPYYHSKFYILFCISPLGFYSSCCLALTTSLREYDLYKSKVIIIIISPCDEGKKRGLLCYDRKGRRWNSHSGERKESGCRCKKLQTLCWIKVNSEGGHCHSFPASFPLGVQHQFPTKRSPVRQYCTNTYTQTHARTHACTHAHPPTHTHIMLSL